MKFLLKEGLHSELDQIIPYEKGSVIETSRDLVRIYGPEKFQRADDSVPATRNPDITNAPQAVIQAKAKAAVIEEDEAVILKTKVSPEDTKTPAASAETEEESLPEGDNVTSTFPAAKANDLLVIKHGNAYTVYDDLEKKTVESEVKLTSKDKVSAFLDSFNR